MPTPEQLERSRARNRKRGITEADIREALKRDARRRTEILREAKAGPRFGPKGNGGPCVDRWGGPTPPDITA